MTNKGFYEPSLSPLAEPRRPYEEIFQKLELKHRALENALEWIELRCDTKEFPATYYLIQEALDA